MKQAILHLSILSVVAGTIFFFNLGSAKLWDRDEPRNAGCAIEMMERGNYVVPIFNDELRYQKPVLLYWLIMSAYSVFGVGEFAARFWSVVCGLGTVLVTYGIGCRLAGRNVALLSGIVLASSLMFVVASRAATPDSILILCSTASLLFFVNGTFKNQKAIQSADLSSKKTYFPTHWFYVVGMYSMMGIGTLAKGPVAFVLPMAIIGMFLLIARLPARDHDPDHGRITNWLISVSRPFHPVHFLKTLWTMKPVTAALVVLAIASPWYVCVGIQTQGEWLRIFFLDENIGRASSVYENHSGGIGFYPLMVLLGFFPWSVFIIPTLLNSDHKATACKERRPASLFLMCWVGVQIGLFSLVSTKLPSYITPCFPALSILTSMFLVEATNRWTASSKFWLNWSMVSLSGAGILILVGLAFISRKFLDGNQMIAAIGLIPIVGGFVGYRLLRRESGTGLVGSIVVVAVVFAVALFGFGTTAIDRYQNNQIVLGSIRDADSSTRIATFGCLESTWIFYGRKTVFELNADGPILAEMPTRRNNWEAKPRVSVASFIKNHPNSLILTTDDQLDQLKSLMNCESRIVNRCDYFLKDKQLVLVKPLPQLNASADSKTTR